MSNTLNADGAPQKTETLLDVMPTVFIALGGTGMEILLRLRRRILQADWAGKSIMSIDEFPPARFIYFDTDTAEARESGRAAATDLMASRVAFSKGGETIQKKVDTAYYMAEIDNYPIIREWLPDGDLDKIDTEKGAGQIRSISRLLFFDVYSDFMNLVRTQADRVTQNVTNEERLRSLGLKTGTKLRVVVVGSSAGGTGSGSFIDVGYALRSMRTPKIDQLDLFLMLPGGYRDANKDRVFANTYAALSELEFAMRGTTEPPYTARWTDYDRPAPEAKVPFHDVFLFDRQNIAGQQTGEKTDIFDMVADILFEDFGSSDFARRKRSVAVNQQQFKLGSYFPKLPEWLKDGMHFSRGYSAIGQTTLISTASMQVDEHLSRNNAAMLRSFFGMAVGDSGRQPTTEERDAFMRDLLRLRVKAYADDYDERARFECPVITDFELVDFLLMREDKSSIASTLASEIEQDFAGILSRISDHRAWANEVRRLVELRMTDVDGRIGQSGAYGPKGAEVAKARDRFERALLAKNVDDGSLRATLYQILDDQDRGGLEFTIGLVTQIKRRLEEAGQGTIARLAEAEEAYARRANRINSEQLQASIDRTQQAAGSSFLTGGGRKASERYLSQVRDDLTAALQARLRAIACKEAINLLHNASAFLGNPQGIDDTGDTIWSGLIGEFQTGRKRVRGLLSVIDGDTARIQDALKRGDGGTFFVLKDSGIEISQAAHEDQVQWAREAFDGLGGSREIFASLEQDEGRLEILGRLRSVTMKRLGGQRDRIPSVTDALRQLPLAEQQRLLDLLVVRAMPWIYTDFSRGFRPENERYKMFIAVDGVDSFRSEFNSMILSRLPAQSGLTAVAYEESGVPGRIVCYCELSGFPLDAVAPIRSEWRPSYLREQAKPDGLPLHNHRDDLRFPDPIVPTNSDLDVLRERIELFLKGVFLGALRFNVKSRRYEIEIGKNHWEPVGEERYLRRRGFQPSEQAKLQDTLNKIEGGLSALQYAGLAALARWFADRVYTPRKFDRGQGPRITRGGIGNHVAHQLEQAFLTQAQRTSRDGELSASLEGTVDRLYETVDRWTTTIFGTIGDVEDTEVGRDLDDPVERRATEKRMVEWSKFSEEGLRAIVSDAPSAAPAHVIGAPATTVASRPSAPPPPPGTAKYWLFNAAGQVVGPYDANGFEMLAQLGQLRPEMKVCLDGSQTWQSVSDVPALASLLSPRSTTPPAPPPLPN
ncbi:tubulin-like doman-containing protein [Consotaella salsifontis]|uniref:Tubulin like n=1 Tax=Consotaella salsifontis TaxID=1365950 RepID=A0A1T4LKI1_9HYPH|nr:tubulin-like doman-containing protein [Consotaella salsifontis]SJZ55038.1 Tubulin like [Consotaella salsifontis]